MQVFPVGCIENGAAIYIHVAAPDADSAEKFVGANRPYLQVISTLDSVGEYPADKIQTVKISTKIESFCTN